MNEKIKKIAEEAWGYVNADHYIEGDTSTTFTVDDIVAFENKFSELLVRECADLCMQEYRTPDGWGRTNGDVRCHELICKTFDIESRWG
jgi:hypothetical protein